MRQLSITDDAIKTLLQIFKKRAGKKYKEYRDKALSETEMKESIKDITGIKKKES